MNVSDLAAKMVEAAEHGEAEWGSHEELVKRFSSDGSFPDNINSLPVEIERLGWRVVPAIIKNWETLENGQESGNPEGYRLERP